MPKPERVEVIPVGDGEFKIKLPTDYTGAVQLNCSTGTVVNFQATETRRPAKGVGVDMREQRT